MYCIAKLIELLTLQDRSLGQIRSELPRVAYRSASVRCPWMVKGALMRHLVENNPSEMIDLTDGVKIFKSEEDRESWILVLPDAGEPLVHLYANSVERKWVDDTLRNYRTRVQEFVEAEEGMVDSASVAEPVYS